jgi:predicted methyltransferase
MGPLLTHELTTQFAAAIAAGVSTLTCSLDLGRTTTTVILGVETWNWQGQIFPYLPHCKERSIYYWCDGRFDIVARYDRALIKLVPTSWGPPTFEIDGIKMLPTAQISPYEDAKRKVELIQPRNKVILDTCGGLGYFAAWCVAGQAKQVISFEKNPDVIWLRGINPWSPQEEAVLSLTNADVVAQLSGLPDASVDAILHDPPRFGIAGELYAQTFYDQLARVIRRKGRLFHYTGTPNKLSSGRDLPNEVAKRLRLAGFATERQGDGLLALKK